MLVVRGGTGMAFSSFARSARTGRRCTNGSALFFLIFLIPGFGQSNISLGAADNAIATSPAIASFQALPSIVGPGARTTLVAIFSGGAGSVNGGVGTIRSGEPVSTGKLARSTTFTLTVASAGKVSVHAAVTVRVGHLDTFAGEPSTAGSRNGKGASAKFDRPTGIAADTSGNLYIADSGNSVIRKVTPEGVVTTFAGFARHLGSTNGKGAEARFFEPSHIAIGPGGDLFVTDRAAADIRKITSQGEVTTLAGSSGRFGTANGAGANARFDAPAGIGVDRKENVYVADSTADTIRKITPDGRVSTFAGVPGRAGTNNGDGSAARFGAPMGIAVGPAGNIFVADSSNFTVRKSTPAGNVVTFAGKPEDPGSANGAGSSARFYFVYDVAVDTAGNIFAADLGNFEIRKISPAGAVSTLAGSISSVPSGGSTNGMGRAARFYAPRGVAAGRQGEVYVADTLNGTIREISPEGVVSTLAGTPIAHGFVDATGTAASFDGPQSAVVDRAGSVFVTDNFNNAIRKITSRGLVSTFATGLDGPSGIAFDEAGNLYVANAGADTVVKVSESGRATILAGSPRHRGSRDGQGTEAEFNNPAGVALDRSGNVYLVDNANNTIRRISPDGDVTTFAGKAGESGGATGKGTAARFTAPEGIAINSGGTIYITDTGNNRICRITQQGEVASIAGGEPGYADGQGAKARFNRPWGLSLDNDGNLLVADLGNQALRMITPAGVVTTIAGTPGLAENDPGPLPAALRFPLDVAVDPETGELYVVLQNAVLKIAFE